MRKSFIITLSSLCFISCVDSREQSASEEAPQPIEEKLPDLNNKEVPVELLSLHEPEEEENEEQDTIKAGIGGNLYGRFFNERAEFFIIDSPTNKLHDTEVESITLYYLDGQLGKTKYILQQNIAEALIKAYGNFKISGHDPKNRELIKSRMVLIRTDEDDFELNPQLDNYTLKWASGNNLIVYNVNSRDPQETYRYVEKWQTYDRNFRSIERFWVPN